jgi:hypothetical protein
MKLYKIGKLTIDLDKLDFEGLKLYIKDLTEEKYFEITGKKVEKIVKEEKKKSKKHDFSGLSEDIHKTDFYKDSE